MDRRTANYFRSETGGGGVNGLRDIECPIGKVLELSVRHTYGFDAGVMLVECAIAAEDGQRKLSQNQQDVQGATRYDGHLDCDWASAK